jgi:hypothetical protein
MAAHQGNVDLIDQAHKWKHRAPSISQVLSRNGWAGATLLESLIYRGRVTNRAAELLSIERRKRSPIPWEHGCLQMT